MTEENWVMLPEPAPKMLPVGTRLLTRHGFRWELKGPHMLTSEWGLRSRRAYLGDHIDLCTGAGLSGALCEASDIEGVLLPPGYRFEGSEVVKEEPKPEPTYATFAQAWSLSDYVFRQGDYQQNFKRRYGDCPRPECARKSWNPDLDRCDHCGVTGKEIAAKRAKPACKCGATENVRHVAWGQPRSSSRPSATWTDL